MGKAHRGSFQSALSGYFNMKIPLIFNLSRDTVKNFFSAWSTDSNKVMKQEPSLINSMFPSLFDGIRHGIRQSVFSDFIERTDVCKESNHSSSNVRFIPIKLVSGQQPTGPLKDSPIILDDDVVEVIDHSENDFVAPKNKAKGSYVNSNKSSLLEKITAGSITIDEEADKTSPLSKFSFDDSRCSPNKTFTESYSEINKLDILKAEPLAHREFIDKPLTRRTLNVNSVKSQGDINSLNSKGRVIVIDDSQEDLDIDLPDNITLCKQTLSTSHPGVEVVAPSHFDEVENRSLPSYPVYDMLVKELTQENRKINYVTGDGNCFFRALSKILYGCENYHKGLRQFIVDIIATNKVKFAQFIDGEDVQEHIERMSEDHCWATTCEIYAAATVLQRDIFMLTPDHLNKNYSWLLFNPLFKITRDHIGITKDFCYITLCNTNGNHYDLIVADHGKCNCFLPQPELEGVHISIDLT